MRAVCRYILPLLLLCSGCYDRVGDGGDAPSLPIANTSLSVLRTMAASGCYEVQKDIVCEGRVTTTTKEGNFYRTLYIEDESGAVELLLGLYDADALYPEGLKVVLKLKGTAVMVEDGVVKVGLPPNSYDNAPRDMESQVVIDRHIFRSNSVEPVSPIESPVYELSESMCGRLVCVSGVHYAPLEDEGSVSLEGRHRFESVAGDVVYSYVSEYADFATEPLPNGEVAICGILSYEYIREASQRCFVVTPRRLSDYFMERNTSMSSLQNLSTVAISNRSSGE